MESKAAVGCLGALAQESRLAIFRLLVETGPEGLCVGDIGSKLKLAPATLSFHLKELMNAELVTQVRDGRYLIYRAAFDQMNAVLGYLTENCCQGAACAVTESTASCKC